VSLGAEQILIGRSDAFAVVGVGASSTSLQALETLLAAVPPGESVAFFVVLAGSSALREPLQARAGHAWPVSRAVAGERLRPGYVYWAYADEGPLVADDTVSFAAVADEFGRAHAFDRFLLALAKAFGPRSGALVFDGPGYDGAEGVQHVHAAGGFVVAEDVRSAQPAGERVRAVLATGRVDAALTPGRMGPALLAHWSPVARPLPRGGEAAWEALLRILHQRTGVDFRAYSESTLRRRLERRLVVAGDLTLDAYLDYLALNPSEADQLARELTLGVARFFSDAGSLEVLRLRVLPELVREAREPLRVWCPRAASGEEPFSLAITLAEAFEAAGRPPHFKVFATDSDARAVEHAARAVYFPSRVEHLPKERLERWFEPVEAGYRVRQSLRELVVFSQHDVLRDPPFTRLDLATVRALLPFLQPAAQRAVLRRCLLALRPGGHLVMASAQELEGLKYALEPVDAGVGVYRRTALPVPRDVLLPPNANHVSTPASEVDAKRLLDDAYRLLARLDSGVSLVVSTAGTILHSTADASRYLALPVGRASLDITHLARPGLGNVLSAGLLRAQRTHSTVDFEGVEVATPSGPELVKVRITPGNEGPTTSRFLVITLWPQSAPARRSSSADGHGSSTHEEEVIHLEQELARTREGYAALLDEIASERQRLVAANEELSAANETLQSANEALQTGQEQLAAASEARERRLEALAEEAEFAAALDAVGPAVAMLIDERGVIRRATSAAEALLRSRQPLAGATLADALPQVEGESLVRSVQEVIRTGEPKSAFLELARSTFRVELSALVLPAKPRWAGLVLHPVPEAEEPESRAQLFGPVLAASREPMLLVTRRTGQIVEANAAARSLFEGAMRAIASGDVRRLGQPLGTAWDVLLSEASGSARPFELRLGAPAGPGPETIPGRTVLVAEGALVLVVVGDPAEVSAALGSAESQKMEALGKLAGGVAHELNNVLAAILSVTYALRNETASERQEARDLDAILAACRRGGDLTRSLLGFARRGSVVREPVDLAAVVEDVVRLVARGTRPNAVSHAELRPGELWVNGDRSQLGQALMNLCVNALDAVGGDGHVRVEACVENVSLPALRRLGPHVCIRVIDNGVGMSEEVKARAFEPFFTTKPRGEGTGLGLAMVYGSARAHGGWTELDSSPGRGTTVSLFLPLNSARVARSTAPPRSVKTGSAGRLLLVDDDVLVRQSLARALGRFGYETVTAWDGASALEQTQRHALRFTAAVLDIRMPGQDGFEVLTELRRYIPDLPAVLCTGYAEREVAALPAPQELTAYLPKPVEPDSLVERLQALIALRSQRQTD
jgi:two-component system CheB/CheR fusion protein